MSVALAFLLSLMGNSVSSSYQVYESGIFRRDDICPETRSLLEIIWSGVSTALACSWVSVHPNVPHSRDGFLTVSLRQIKLMIWALLAPELIILWAGRQWISARKTSERFKAYKHWTMKHSFMLVMGGFMLYDKNDPQEVLSPYRFEQLVEHDAIVFPAITEDEIDDKSKGDFIAKGIVIIQTGWYIIQCVARLAEGLALAQFEVLILAIASLNGMMYFFWWYKPMGVECHIPVYLKQGLPQHIILAGLVDQEEGEKISGKAEGLSDGEVIEEVREPGAKVYAFKMEVRVESPTPIDGSEDTSVSWKTRARNFIESKRAEVKEEGFFMMLWVWFWYRPVFYPFFQLIGETDNSIHRGQRRLPTFYSPNISTTMDNVLGITFTIASTISGGLHLIAWSFDFPSHTHQLIWRSGSLILTVVPAFVSIQDLSLQFFIQKYIEEKSGDGWLGGLKKIRKVILSFVYFAIPCMALLAYAIVRVIIVIQAAILLRYLPPKAFIEVEWSHFIPHF